MSRRAARAGSRPWPTRHRRGRAGGRPEPAPLTQSATQAGTEERSVSMSILVDRSGTERSILWPVLVTIAVQLLLALATALIKLRSGSDDTDIYYHYATMAMVGEVPYRDYRVEYPPLSLVLFLVPRLIASDIASFKFAFAIEMLVFNAATVWAVAAWVERKHGPARVGSRLAWDTVFFLFLARLFVARFGAVPMFLGFVASTWWFSGRVVVGGLAASLGALTKVYPAVVAVLASTWDLTRPGSARGRGLAAFCLALTLGVGAWLALAGF